MYVPVDESTYWDERYKMNLTGWDTNRPNPVFAEFLENPIFLKPCKMLIIGSGKGYDAVLAAQKGYDVSAVDFSVEANKYAVKLAQENDVKVNFIARDIFTLGNERALSFDAVYEYTTYCAINPARRDEFAKKISSFLKTGGRFITVLFPVDNREGGPPFKIDLEEFYKIFSKYLSLEFSTKQINSVKPRKGKEVLQIYYKK